ncbi:hypothetical protein PS6_011823, partial [Mucor atramentarius]
MAFEYNNWTNNDLLNQKDWEAAKVLFRKHFGTPASAEESMALLFSMRMQESDTLQEYTNTFIKHVQDCGFPVNSNLLARFYQFTLLQKNKQMMINQMAVKHDPKYKWTINEIYECILPLFLVDEQNRVNGVSKGKRKMTDSYDGNPRGKGPKLTITGFFCPKHGGDTANHNAIDCRSRTKNFGSENRPNRATSAAPFRGAKSSSSSTNICNYCHKPRTFGHKCQEFYDWKREREAKKNINVHTVQTIADGSSASGSANSNNTGSSSGSNDATKDDAAEGSAEADNGDAVEDISMED